MISARVMTIGRIMKLTLIFGLLFFLFSCYAQNMTGRKSKPDTLKYSGTYGYGDINKTRTGTVTIYPETDSTILFYIDLNRGGPSFNMGSDYGRVKIINGTGIYYIKGNEGDKSCKWSFEFNKNNLIIKTLEHQDNCGFGYGVYVDGTFTQTSNRIIEYFENQEGTKIYFKNIH